MYKIGKFCLRRIHSHAIHNHSPPHASSWLRSCADLELRRSFRTRQNLEARENLKEFLPVGIWCSNYHHDDGILGDYERTWKDFLRVDSFWRMIF